MKPLLFIALAAVLWTGGAQAATGDHGVAGGGERPGPAAAKPVLLEAKVVSLDAAAHSIKLEVETDNGIEKVTADTARARPVVATLEPGDQIRARLLRGDNAAILDATLETRWAEPFLRWKALLGSFLLLAVLAGLATRGRLYRFVVGVDNRYSKSQVQIVIWAGLTGSAYLATLFLRVYEGGPVGGIGITNNLLLLSGLSALSFGAAKAITAGKNDTVAGPRKTIGASPRLSDLVNDDLGRPDFGDFQMLAITLIAAAIYLWKVFVWLGPVQVAASLDLPDIDTFLLAGFGIGQGAYLAKKAVLPVGQG